MTTQELEFDRSQLGVEYDAGTFPVKADAIINSCLAMGESNPIYINEKAAQAAGHPALVAPPAFCGIFVRGFGRPDIGLKAGGGGMHAGEVIENLVPVYAGDVLTAKTSLKDVYAKTGRTGTMVFVVWKTAFTNQRGEKVADVQESFMRRATS